MFLYVKFILPMKTALTLLFLSVFIFSLQASEQEMIIERLIKRVENSGARFIRNGDEHSAKDAAKHLRGKWKRGKVILWFKTGSNQFTPEQFITHIASKSSMSDSSYKMKFSDGKIIETKNWLEEQLQDILKNNYAKNEEKAN